MLEFLRRHHKTFWIVITAVVIISFTFWGGMTKTGNRGRVSDEAVAFTAYGRDYDFSEYERLGRLHQVASMLGLTVFDGRVDFASAVTSFAPRFQFTDPRRVSPDFAFNLIMLRHELERHGIRASDAEADQKLHDLPVFQTQGQADPAKLSRFENLLGSYGMRVPDARDLVRDWLGMEKLIQIVAGNVEITPHLANQFYTTAYQTIKASTIPFAMDAFRKTVQVTDEEIKKYYEQKKDTFKTPDKRGVSYVFFESPKDLDKLPAEERMKKNNAFNDVMATFTNEAVKDGAKFEELAKTAKAEVKKAALFTQAEPPAELKDEFQLVFEIFNGSADPKKISAPIKGSKGYYFYQVTEEQKPRQQELTDVQDKIKDALVAQKARVELMKAANDARKALADAIKGGKKFEDAAKDAKLEPKALGEFTVTEPPEGLSNARQIAFEAMRTPAGEFTKPLESENGAVIVFVTAKELRKRDDGVSMRERVTQDRTASAQADVFRAWFDRRREEAKVVPRFKIDEAFAES